MRAETENDLMPTEAQGGKDEESPNDTRPGKKSLHAALPTIEVERTSTANMGNTETHRKLVDEPIKVESIDIELENN